MARPHLHDRGTTDISRQAQQAIEGALAEADGSWYYDWSEDAEETLKLLSSQAEGKRDQVGSLMKTLPDEHESRDDLKTGGEALGVLSENVASAIGALGEFLESMKSQEEARQVKAAELRKRLGELIENEQNADKLDDEVRTLTGSDEWQQAHQPQKPEEDALAAWQSAIQDIDDQLQAVHDALRDAEEFSKIAPSLPAASELKEIKPGPQPPNQ